MKLDKKINELEELLLNIDDVSVNGGDTLSMVMSVVAEIKNIQSEVNDLKILHPLWRETPSFRWER